MISFTKNGFIVIFGNKDDLGGLLTRGFEQPNSNVTPTQEILKILQFATFESSLNVFTEFSDKKYYIFLKKSINLPPPV